MPRGDGMGPQGMGPMTGRGAGYCAGYATPGYANPWVGGAGYGYGRGAGRGRGMGWGRGYGPAHGYGYVAPVYPAVPANPWMGPVRAPMDNVDQLAFLRDQAEQLGHTLSRIEQQIRALEEKESE